MRWIDNGMNNVRDLARVDISNYYREMLKKDSSIRGFFIVADHLFNREQSRLNQKLGLWGVNKKGNIDNFKRT